MEFNVVSHFDSIFEVHFTVTFHNESSLFYSLLRNSFPLFSPTIRIFFQKIAIFLTEPDSDAIFVIRGPENNRDFDHCKQPSKHK
jgi:hypothetical protein